VNISPFPPVCPICKTPLGLDVSGCLLCGRFMCGHHLVVRKGVGACPDCEPRRAATESSSVVTEADEARIVDLLTRDLLATVGPGHEAVAVAEAARVRLFAESLLEYERRVVEDVQQRLHDEFIDTTWPTCPSHPNHPLWYSKGSWWCSRQGVVAAVGALASGGVNIRSDRS
jgi:hypothetical protein